ncbi:MAG: hypothetical protein K9J17_08100 [Flavobacteriales bacterium]|nr:hypothetical protein [Flavobacteriales bacterium]
MLITSLGYAQESEPAVTTDSTINIIPNMRERAQKGKRDSVLTQAPDTALIVTGDKLFENAALTSDSLSLKPKKKKTDLEDEIKYHAKDSIRFSVEDKKVFLYGEAQINYQDIELKAAYIEIDQATKEVYAEGVTDSLGKTIGTPEFKSGDQNFSSKRMRYNFDTGKGKILDVVTQQGEGNIRGEKVKKTEESHYYIEDGGYTTCDAEEPHYMIKAKKLKVIPNDKIVSGPAFLMFEGVYTPLVVPFALFPTKPGRKSGIIFPEYGESPSQGFFFRNMGYYFNLGEKMDLAVTGDIYTQGSYAVRLNSKYNKRYKFNGSVELSHNSLRNSQKAFPDYSVQNNFFIKWNHQQDPKSRPSTTFQASVNAGTSNYFSNGLVTNAQNYLTNTFQSNISFSKRWIGTPFTISVNMSHSQNTQNKLVTVTLPQIAFNMQRIYPFKRKNQIGKQRWYEKIGLSYSLRTENSVTSPDSTFFTRSILDKMKNGVIHNIPISTSFKAFKYFTISPSVTYNERWFFQTLDKKWNNETQQLDVDTTYGFYSNRDVSTSVNMTTTVYGLVQFKKGPIRGIRHTFNPTVGFLYTPKLNKDEIGYYGNNASLSPYNHDALSIYGQAPKVNTGAATFSLGNTLEMKVRSKKDTITGFKKVKLLEQFSIGTRYNFFADSLNLSDISINGNTHIFEKLGLNVRMLFTPYAQDSNHVKQNRWLINETKQLTRLTNASVALTFSLNGKGKQDYQSNKGTPDELAQINANKNAYIDFNIPWNLNVSYNFAVNNLTNNLKQRFVQTLQFWGDVNITPKWKFGVTSGYDFVGKNLSYTSVTIYRDLHCWDFSMTWVPFGAQQQWSFDLKVKANILSDLKLSRRKNAFDF